MKGKLNLSQLSKKKQEDFRVAYTNSNHVRVLPKYIEGVNVPGYRGWLLNMLSKKNTGRNSSFFSLENFK